MEQAPNNKIEDIFKKELTWTIERIFDIGENEKGRQDGINKAILKLLPFFELIPNSDFMMRDLLTNCAKIEDRQAFVEKVISILGPLFRFKESEPLVWEEARRKIFLEDARAIRLNDILAYSIDGQEISLHLPPAREFINAEGLISFREKIREALVLLADIVFKNKDITRIVGISWIVARSPKLLESLGFTVEHGLLPDQDGPMGKRPVSSAFMSREDFLNKYHRG